MLSFVNLRTNLFDTAIKEDDEMFVILSGKLVMDFRDGKTIPIRTGAILIVPKEQEHRPWTNGEEVMLMLIEPKTTQHVG